MSDAAELIGEIEVLGDRLAQAKASINRRFIGRSRATHQTVIPLLLVFPPLCGL